MVDFNSKVGILFPELYTTKGTLRKLEPKKYICNRCGKKHSKTFALNFTGIGFAIPRCPNCNAEGKENNRENKELNVWTRMVNGQIKEEDLILNTVFQNGIITKEKLESVIKMDFNNPTRKSIGYLVYWGYLAVDKKLREDEGIIQYSLGNKDIYSDRIERYV